MFGPTFLADLDRAVQYLEPATQLTATGMQIGAHHTMTPPGTPWANRTHIAWKTYQPTAPRTSQTVLFIAGSQISGVVYHEAALWLAEQGLPTHAMSLGGHGYGHWASYDPLPLEQMTLERYLGHVVSVCQEIQRVFPKVILAGDGLGGILAQRYAQTHADVVGLVLLGSCSPHRAAAVWRPAPWWQRRRHTQARHLLTLDEVRATLLDRESAEQEVVTLWQGLQAAPPLLPWEYRRLARQAVSLPSVPLLLIAGEKDQIVPPEVRDGTAADYGVQPVVLAGAPHLVAWTHAAAVAERMAQFALALTARSGATGQDWQATVDTLSRRALGSEEGR